MNISLYKEQEVGIEVRSLRYTCEKEKLKLPGSGGMKCVGRSGSQ